MQGVAKTLRTPKDGHFPVQALAIIYTLYKLYIIYTLRYYLQNDCIEFPPCKSGTNVICNLKGLMLYTMYSYKLRKFKMSKCPNFSLFVELNSGDA